MRESTGWLGFLGGAALALVLAPAEGVRAQQGKGKAEGSSGAESPAEALQKAGPPAKTTSNAGLSYSGGLFRVKQPEDDLYEPVPEGTKAEFEKSGYAVVTEGKIDLVVDAAGQIYVDRNYHGIVPGLRAELEPGELSRLARQDLVLWAGFQPMSSVSRLFWLLSDPSPRFEVTKLDEKTLEVFFPGADIRHDNTIRPLITDFFVGPVSQVEGSRARGGIRYIVRLKREANYLYRFENPYLFLDFETDNL